MKILYPFFALMVSMWLPGCDDVPFPIGEGRDVVLDLPVLERHWVPDPKMPGCGTLYVLAEGDAGDLARHTATFQRMTPPIADKRFVQTSTTVPWWTPPTTPTEVYGRATIDHPPASPHADAEVEFVITSKGNRVFYEQRVLPLRATGVAPTPTKKSKAEQQVETQQPLSAALFT